MKKIHLLWLTLVALFAFGAVVANAAFAEEALWLIKGVEAKAATPSETKGELLLIVLSEPLIGETQVLCSGAFTGTVGPGSKDEITGLLNLAAEAISTEPLVGLGLLCEGEKGCEKTTDVEVWPDNLPWQTALELTTVEAKTVFIDLFFKTGAQPGYHIAKCLVIGTSNTDLCTGETSSTIELVLTELKGKFLPEGQELANQEANCETAGAKEAFVEGEGTITLTSGEELDVSSP